MVGCLDGTRVLELSRFQAGPRCGMQLSDLGAEVIKIEQPGGESNRGKPPFADGQSIYFSVYNRGKKSLCLDMRKPEGKAIFLDLLKHTDFVLENYRPGTMEKMGLGYDELCKVKPDVIMLRVSSFGQYGPYKDLPGIDPVGQAMSGLMMLTGRQENRPIQTAFSLVDRTTALNATIGALAALLHRQKTGEGQIVDVCLLDAAMTMVEIPTSAFLSTGNQGEEGFRKAYKAKDGWVIVECVTHESQKRAVVLIGRPNLFEESNLAASHPLDTLSARKHPLMDALSAWCANHSVDEICREMRKIDVVVAPVLTIPEVSKSPHLWEREMMVKERGPEGSDMYLPGLSIKFSKAPGGLGPVPAPGEHSDEILSRLLRYDGARIAELHRSGIVTSKSAEPPPDRASTAGKR